VLCYPEAANLRLIHPGAAADIRPDGHKSKLAEGSERDLRMLTLRDAVAAGSIEQLNRQQAVPNHHFPRALGDDGCILSVVSTTA
jgi:hypothetical protein